MPRICFINAMEETKKGVEEEEECHESREVTITHLMPPHLNAPSPPMSVCEGDYSPIVDASPAVQSGVTEDTDSSWWPKWEVAHTRV